MKLKLNPNFNGERAAKIEFGEMFFDASELNFIDDAITNFHRIVYEQPPSITTLNPEWMRAHYCSWANSFEELVILSYDFEKAKNDFMPMMGMFIGFKPQPLEIRENKASFVFNVDFEKWSFMEAFKIDIDLLSSKILFIQTEMKEHFKSLGFESVTQGQILKYLIENFEIETPNDALTLGVVCARTIKN